MQAPLAAPRARAAGTGARCSGGNRTPAPALRPTVCTRAYLEAALYDPNAAVSPNALETSMSRLRSLITGMNANVEIKTVRGVGYALTEGGLG